MSKAHRDLTTGETAKLLRVSIQTVIRLIDTGVLKGYRVPASKFRRVPREEVERVLRETRPAASDAAA